MGDEEQRKVGVDLLTYAQASRQLAQTRLAEKDWSGLPVPVAGLSLVLEPRYKHKALEEFRWKECFDDQGVRYPIAEEPPPEPSEFRTVNSWWNSRCQMTIVVVQDKQGRAQSRVSLEDRIALMMRTLHAAAVWPIEAEQLAEKKLASLIPEDMFELYLLTGHFSEVSKRSQLTYLFRKGRPTIVFRENEDDLYLLCALCLHPISYYDSSWAGVMCPTDEVIAHLLMMRGSEEKFWANANQHPLDRPSAGV